MNTTELQVQLFQHIKNKSGNNSLLVDEIASMLGISPDSAYRRIRGEKAITMEELCKLANHYKLSLDSLLNIRSDTIPFQGKYVDPSSFRFEEYLLAVGQQVKYMASFKERAMYYLCKDK